MTLWKKPINFFARREHFVDHMLPVWDAMDGARGKFYVPECIAEYAAERVRGELKILKSKSTLNPLFCGPDESAPTFVSAYGDLQQVLRTVPQSPLLMMEHGVGLTFSGHPGYAGGVGLRNRVGLFLAPNEIIRKQTRHAIPRSRQVIVGTPKLDYLARDKSLDEYNHEIRAAAISSWRKPVVCISFHWNGEKVAPEAGNAYKHYLSILPALAAQTDFEIIGHGHPKYRFVLQPDFEAAGIRFVENFADVLAQADLYVNDCSSTMYEFAVTGKPVIILNAPWFRRNVNHGIRFWDYTDIGPQVEHPAELIATIHGMIAMMKSGADDYEASRNAMVKDLYPHHGHAAHRAAAALLAWQEAQNR